LCFDNRKKDVFKKNIRLDWRLTMPDSAVIELVLKRDRVVVLTALIGLAIAGTASAGTIIEDWGKVKAPKVPTRTALASIRRCAGAPISANNWSTCAALLSDWRV
jgi:hypothetical protein